MSHFTTLKTQIKDTAALVKALADLGFDQVEVYDSPKNLYGFQGDRRSDRAEVIVRRKYIGALSNDIGFQRQADGTLTAIISDYDRRQRFSTDWVNRLTQRYAYHHLMAIAPTEGFSIDQQEELADGTLRVVLGRWV